MLASGPSWWRSYHEYPLDISRKDKQLFILIFLALFYKKHSNLILWTHWRDTEDNIQQYLPLFLFSSNSFLISDTSVTH